MFPQYFYQNGVSFLRRLALQKEKNLITARVFMLLKSRASPDMLPFSLCNKKRLGIRYMNRPPLSSDAIDSVLRHREVGRAKDLSASPRVCVRVCVHIYTYIYIYMYVYIYNSSQLWLRRSVACLSPRSTVFGPTPLIEDLRWTWWHCDRFLSQYSCSPLSVPFHQRSTLILIYMLLVPEQTCETWEPSKGNVFLEMGSIG